MNERLRMFYCRLRDCGRQTVVVWFVTSDVSGAQIRVIVSRHVSRELHRLFVCSARFDLNQVHTLSLAGATANGTRVVDGCVLRTTSDQLQLLTSAGPRHVLVRQIDAAVAALTAAVCIVDSPLTCAGDCHN